jgi:hypothetical protein
MFVFDLALVSLKGKSYSLRSKMFNFFNTIFYINILNKTSDQSLYKKMSNIKYKGVCELSSAGCGLFIPFQKCHL